MRPQDFRDFEECAGKLNYKNIPYSKLCELVFSKDSSLYEIKYKTNFQEDHITVSIFPKNIPERQLEDQRHR